MSFFQKFKRAWLAFVAAWNEPSVEKVKEVVHKDFSHLQLLAYLQQKARLIDFFKEDLSFYSDQQIGSSVRKIHADCNKALEEWVTIRPLSNLEEGSQLTVPQGFHPEEIKLTGTLSQNPPFKGTLLHPGWKAHKHSLPERMVERPEILMPQEVEAK